MLTVQVIGSGNALGTLNEAKILIDLKGIPLFVEKLIIEPKAATTTPKGGRSPKRRIKARRQPKLILLNEEVSVQN